ncbi:MAG: single-stranded DNA-binding protein [Gammaproteobacteria bacterium]|nr:single-stranded DNA-binding protein [Gammaproteobacteria bacterium]
MSVNKAIIVGRLGSDPEVRLTQTQTTIATLSIATSYNSRSKNGERIEETEWHRVVCFGRTAELARDYLKKGQMVYVEGRIRTRKWKDQQGMERSITEIVCDTMRFLSSPEKTASESYASPSIKASYSVKQDANDVPF